LADEKNPGKRNDLTSKIAAAYRNAPPESREKAGSGDEIQNPELDRAFEKMVQTYKTKRPEAGPVVPFPRSSARPIDELDEEGDEAAQECPECGNIIPPGNKFCGDCGTPRDEAVALQRRRENESELAAISTESGIKHHHHYYHHHHYRNNPYLLVAIAGLLLVIAWQQWRDYQRSMAPVNVPQAAPMKQSAAPAVTPAPAAPAQAELEPAASVPVSPKTGPSGRKPSPTNARKARASAAPTPDRRFPDLVPPPKVTPAPPKQ